ncbi:MAG: TetR/AcrR family transcriptional regulator [Actinobacteria bacterium]|nr:TetR/AcrR family transcriptional regulator [Actinomycetota bacterium]
MTLEEKSRTTRNRILESAISIFSEKDYEKTDIDEICEKANVTKGAFYYHFNTKQDLLLVLLNQWMESIGSILDEADRQSKDLASALINIPDKLISEFTKDINKIAVFLQFYIKGISDPALKDTIKTSYEDFLVFFSAVIKKSGIKKFTPRKTSRILFALIIGLLTQGLIDPEGEDWANFAKEILKLFLPADINP